MNAGGGWNEGGKNRWRYKEGSEQKIIEIELTQGKVALIDAERLEEVGKHRWWAVKARSSVDVWYAHAEIRKPGKEKISNTTMHVVLFPDILPPRDHIDRNGLNNVAANIRCGKNGINTRNTYTKKDEMGVTEVPHLRRYRAVWKEVGGKEVEKVFTWSQYPSKEAAYEAAVLCRRTNAQRVIEEIERHNAINPLEPFQKYVRAPQKSNSGLKNILIRDRDTQMHRVVATIELNKQRFIKSFTISHYDNDESKAIESAQEWLEKVKSENPRKRKIGE